MFFRLYLFLNLAVLVFIGALGHFAFVLLLSWPAIALNHSKWKKSQAHIEKSLSFGIKSMKRQKQNFKAINFVFAKVPLVQKLLKKASILLDDMHVRYGYTGITQSSRINSIDSSSHGFTDTTPFSSSMKDYTMDYTTNPAFRDLSYNIHHDSTRKH